MEKEKKDQEKIEEEGKWAKISLFCLELVKVAVLAGLTIGLVRYFLFKPFVVRGQSMEPNFFERDYLIIDELSYRLREPKRGEVIVFRAPIGDDYYLKRVIGLPGERVKIEDSKVIVYNEEYPQGAVVEELYLEEETPGMIIQTLGEDEFFVMGDNRDSSYDSRRFGPIGRQAIVGRALVRGLPLSKITTFSTPQYNL
ncbi:MAG TPA: signal peptidase I [Patescibacteria group bacterium]|nr:signal peptidase I [Patescibacteria group bacterium]